MADNISFIIDEEKEKKLLEKYANFVFLLDFWMKLIEDGKDIDAFFRKRGYDNISIYGMGILGKHLKCQLENAGLSVLFVIDSDKIFYDDRCFNLDTEISRIRQPDVIVVTPIVEYKGIREKIEKLTTAKIISLEEVILSI